MLRHIAIYSTHFQVDGEVVNPPYAMKAYGLTISITGNAIRYQTDSGVVISLTETGNLNVGLPKYYRQCVKGCNNFLWRCFCFMNDKFGFLFIRSMWK